MTADVSRADLEGRLRDIHAITDAALARLDDHDLLAELMERTRTVLRADTATVLVLDFSSGELIATAAAGLDEEVRQGVRVPLGRGFAGRIAAERQPVILDQVNHRTVLNPILWAKGIRALMGVPLIAGGAVVGVLHVGSLTARDFTTEDLELLQLAADRAATAVQSLTARGDRAAVEALQRSLLPSALPAADGAQIAVRYVPGHGTVGGDWYDVFSLPSGQLAVVIGDVAGSGLPAAVIMGRMRSALRAYALDTCDPAEVLGRLDRKMQHFEPGAMATVAYAVFEPGLDRAHICLAGHLPPVIAAPGQPAVLADVPGGLLIGAAPGAHRRAATLDIDPGTVMCFYTDGLIERRNQLIDHGLAMLCQTVTAQHPDAACAAVMSALVGSEPAHDDIALLMFRRQQPGGQHYMPSEESEARSSLPPPTAAAPTGKQSRPAAHSHQRYWRTGPSRSASLPPGPAPRRYCWPCADRARSSRQCSHRPPSDVTGMIRRGGQCNFWQGRPLLSHILAG